ncbi:hypothetical protein Pyn_07458 [Prunus yedoensis var. nudiflora]|uniref:Uncharacterized protein n=1 Tax=Prunus yedoensis var. nudiflora TaxID=2094558 RepID=A0A314XSK7_PRUYE|nr:hypothetical protein Pyn_07458 [Prunus yedoensis var. nudiflora]
MELGVQEWAWSLTEGAGTWNPSTDKRSAICCSNKPAFFVPQRRVIFPRRCQRRKTLPNYRQSGILQSHLSHSPHSATGVKKPTISPQPQSISGQICASHMTSDTDFMRTTLHTLPFHTILIAPTLGHKSA